MGSDGADRKGGRAKVRMSASGRAVDTALIREREASRPGDLKKLVESANPR